MKSNNSLEDENYLYLASTWGYENGVDILNDICELYKTKDTTGYISTARSVNKDDIDKLTGVTAVNNRIYKMIFENMEENEGKKYLSYWLASSSRGYFDSKSDYWLGMSLIDGGRLDTIFLYMMISGNLGNCHGEAVRPVVSLKSEITKQQVPKIPDQVNAA